MIFQPRMDLGWLNPKVIYGAAIVLAFLTIWALVQVTSFLFTPVDLETLGRESGAAQEHILQFIRDASQYPAFWCCCILPLAMFVLVIPGITHEIVEMVEE